MEWTKVEKVGLPATTRRVGKVDKVTYILYENPEDSYVLISVINVERAQYSRGFPKCLGYGYQPINR